MSTHIHRQAYTHKQTGYTLLFAVMTAALVLGVAVFILSVSKKQYDLAVTARESMYAIYAADGAIECMALQFISITTPVSITCNGTSIVFAGSYVTNVQFPNFAPDPYSLSSGKVFHFSTDPTGPCAVVMVISGLDQTTLTPKTYIEARGYNQCDASGPLASTRTVERALRLTTH